VILKLLLTVFMVVPFFAHAQDDAAESLPEEVVPAPFFSTCFQADAKFGRIPKPGCVTRMRPKWADRAEVFKFNKLGLRGPDYSAAPGPKTFRILLLGPMFDGFNLSEDETANFRLQERLQTAGLKDVEVINGAVSGFYAPRAAEYAIQEIDAYHPDMIIYFQITDAGNHDLVEARSVQGGDQGGGESFNIAGSYSAAPPLLGWMWPDAETQRLIASSFRQLSALWSLHRSAHSAEEETRAYIKPEIEAFQKIQAHLGPDQRLLIFLGAPNNRAGYNTSELTGTWASLFNHATPKTFIPSELVGLYLRSAGFHVYPVARGFRTPVQNDLMFDRRPVSLTAQGSHAFAWSTAFWLRPEILNMPKGEALKLSASGPKKKKFSTKYAPSKSE
jgi:hypothetical protein